MSRPSRSAAGAARKAILANLSAEAGDDSGFAEVDIIDTSNTFTVVKHGRKRKKIFIEPDAPEVIVHEASVQCLPAEIRNMIIKHLDDEKDYWTIYNLMQVSRSWWNHLAKTGSAEEDWLRRITDSMRRSTKMGRGCANYRQTFASAMKSRCVGCWKTTSNSFRHVWLEGPKWLKVCDKCRHREDFYLRVIKSESDRKKMGLLQSELRSLANPEADPSNAGAAALVVDTYLNVIRKRALADLDRLLTGYRGHKDCDYIRRAFEENCFVRQPLSGQIRKAVNEVARQGNCDDKELNHIARAQMRREQLAKSLDLALVRRKMDLEIGRSLLRHFVGSGGSRTVIDTLMWYSYNPGRAEERLVTIMHERQKQIDQGRDPALYLTFHFRRNWRY